MKRSASLGALVATLAGGACTIADMDFTGRRCPCAGDLECVDGVCVAPGTKAADATTDRVDGADSGLCVLALPPNRPSSAGPDEPRLTFTTALRSLDIVDPGGFTFPAFDLDGVCTCVGGAGATCVSRTEICDEPGGVDRAFNGVLATFPQLAGAEIALTPSLVQGRLGVILRVADYNDQADDASVTVDVLFSAGLAGVTDGGEPSPPKFDGTDVYTVLPSSYEAATTKPRFRAAGYVAEGRLVVRLREAVSLGSALPLPLSDSLIVAEIMSRGAQRYLGKGRWAGRLRTREFLTGLSTLTLASQPALCAGTPLFELIKGAVCGRADLSTVVPTPPGTPCDALSVAVALEGAPAADVSGTFERTPPPGRCGDPYVASCD